MSTGINHPKHSIDITVSSGVHQRMFGSGVVTIDTIHYIAQALSLADTQRISRRSESACLRCGNNQYRSKLQMVNSD